MIQEVAQFFEFYYIISAQVPNVSFSELFQIAKNEAGPLNSWNTIGASGPVYGILLAFGMLFPNERIFVFPIPVPIKAKFFVLGYAVIELYLGVSGSLDGVAHFAHLGGMLFGLVLILYWRKNRKISGPYV